MPRKVLFFLAVLLSLAAARAVRADTIQLDGTTAGQYTFNGTTYELSPYGGTLNGTPTSFICVDISGHVPAAGSWQATSTMLTNPTNNYVGTIQGSGTVYLEMAYLATLMINNLAAGHVGEATADQFAIWSFTGGPNPFANTPSSTQVLDLQALQAVQAGFTVTGWQILTPNPGQIGQEMLVMPAPEPSSLLLISGGLFGCVAFRSRRRR